MCRFREKQFQPAPTGPTVIAKCAARHPGTSAPPFTRALNGRTECCRRRIPNFYTSTYALILIEPNYPISVKPFRHKKAVIFAPGRDSLPVPNHVRSQISHLTHAE